MTYTEIIKVNNIEDIVIPDSPGNYKLIFTVNDTANYFGLEKSIEFKINAAEEQEPIYLCFTAEEAGSTVKMRKFGSAPTVYLETSTTGKEGSWTDFTVGSTTITLTNVGDKVYFRAKQDNERFATNII
jgi:hypothetical protein